MLLINQDQITIETEDEQEIEKLKKRGFVSIYEAIAKEEPKKKARTARRSTRSTKVKRSTS